ncbi:MAG: ABC transporter [Alphaproteobacteria bacterium CG_4_9_14_3_um_filter_47_13]|nr:MAG: ABC transporter [Alphaproteobacteria bacterium CG_4_9_14_3_um_filter_47_13]
MGDKILLDIQGLEKTFKQGGESLTILRNLEMSLQKGEMVALVGPSGTGKSTLLQLIGLLDTPTAGRITIDGHDTAKLGESDRTRMRRDFIGFIYQFHYLQPEFSAIENVVIPQMIAGKKKKIARDHAARLLEALGLGHRLNHRPGQLSGGEKQRVAIARALANGPKLLLADEPTGNLDPPTSAEVFNILIDLVRSTGIGALIATHNMDLADQMDKTLELTNGRVSLY